MTNDHDNAVKLSDVLMTEELGQRVPKQPNYRVEAQVMALLAQTLADQPENILHVLTRTAVELCGEGTCGISLLEQNGGEAVFRWVALAGVCEKYAGGCTPRNHSPCGVTLDRGLPQLFRSPGRYFTYLDDVDPPIVEGLVIPFFHGDESFGTIWIVSHDVRRRFNEEDVRIMTRLGAFTSAGLQTVRSLKAANKAREDLAFLSGLRQQLSVAGNRGSLTVAALTSMSRYFLADHCCILEIDHATRGFTVHNESESEWESFMGRHKLDVFGDESFWAAVRAGAVVIRDVRQEPATIAHRGAYERLGFISFATACSIIQDSAQLIWISSRRPRDWSVDEINLLQAAAAHVLAYWAGNQKS